MMRVRNVAVSLIAAALGSGCCPGSSCYDLTLPPNPPGNKVSGVCRGAINYQASSISVGGIEIPFTKVAGGDIKIGKVDVAPQVVRDASDTIKALDFAQERYCETLPFIANNQDAVMKLWLDFNTQQDALFTLARNLNSAQNQTQVTAAIDAAKDLAKTATQVPSAVAAVATSGAPMTPIAPAPPAAPTAPGAPATPAVPGASATSGTAAAPGTSVPAQPVASTGAAASTAATTSGSTPQVSKIADDAIKAAQILKTIADKPTP